MRFYQLLLFNIFWVFSSDSIEIIEVPRSTVRFERLINGLDEPIRKAPYMAALLIDNSLHCGASIIKDDILLTAAHCL